MFGSLVRTAGAGLAARGPEARGFSAMRTDLPGRSLGVTPPRGGVTGRLFPGVGHRARSTQPGAFERPGPTTHTPSTGPAFGISLPIGQPAVLKTRRAARSGLHRRQFPATEAERGLAPRLLALSGAPAGGAALGICVATAVEPTLAAGPGVVFAVPAALAFAAIGAQPPIRFGFGAAAFRAQAGGHPFVGPAAGTGVLGLASFGVPHAPDAGGAAFFGTRAIPHPALAPANLARAATLDGTAAPAACTNATGDSIFNAAAASLTIPPAFVRIDPGHGESPVVGGEDGSEERPAPADRPARQRRFIRLPNMPVAAQPISCTPERHPSAVQMIISL